METKEAYPLCWPAGYQRTQQRKRSLFKQTMDKAQKELRREIGLLGATDLIVSSNIPVRKDGGLYTDWMNRKIDDPGVAIYFERKKKQIALCCDQYETVWENVYALAKGIEKLRGLERDGISDFLDRAFTGFAALPSATTYRPWYAVLGVSPAEDEATVKYQYRQLVLRHHPDKGGDTNRFQEIQQAYEEALQTFKK